jgi:hypothetical protein
MIIRRWALMVVGFAVLLTAMMLMIHQSLSALSTQRDSIEGLKAELTIERERVKSLQFLLKGLSESTPSPTPSCPSSISPSQHNSSSSSSATMKISYDLSLDPWKFTNQGIFDDRLALHPLIKNFRNRSFDWHKLTPPERVRSHALFLTFLSPPFLISSPLFFISLALLLLPSFFFYQPTHFE